jgi:glycerol-3-phosphate acyltransferase PlsY
MPIVLALVAAYLVGSIDFAVIVARMHGVDIHQVGSGNPGTSNVLRTLGKGPAAMVLVGDTLKGLIGAYMGAIAGGLLATSPTSELSQWAYAAGLAAVIGHCYPVFHKFKGGKGIATGLGVMIFTVPLVALIDLAAWALITKLTKVASIASLTVVAITIPLVIWQGVSGMALVWFLLTVTLVVWRHRGNIERMLHGSEEKVSS